MDRQVGPNFEIEILGQPNGSEFLKRETGILGPPNWSEFWDRDAWTAILVQF